MPHTVELQGYPTSPGLARGPGTQDTPRGAMGVSGAFRKTDHNGYERLRPLVGDVSSKIT